MRRNIVILRNVKSYLNSNVVSTINLVPEIFSVEHIFNNKNKGPKPLTIFNLNHSPYLY